MSSSSTNDKVSCNTSGLLSPFTYPASYGLSSGQDNSSRKQNRGGDSLDATRPSFSKAVSSSASLQSPFSSPVSTRAHRVSKSSRRLVEPSSEFTPYSTPVRYHLPTRMRTKPEISCFESDDEDHEDHSSVKKALALASDALAWCTRKRANSLITLKAFKHTDNKVQALEVSNATQLKTREVIADHQWTVGRDPQSQTHKVQWSGSTLNSVTEAYTSLVPMCRPTRESTTLKTSGPAVDFVSRYKEAKMGGGSTTSKWIEWYGSNPFETEEVSRLSNLRPPGPPPNCPLPPLPTQDS